MNITTHLQSIFQLILLLIGLSGNAWAQFSLTDRHEIMLNQDDKMEYNVIPMHEKGLILYGINEPWNYAKQKEFRFSFLDTALNIVQEQSFLLPYDLVKPKKIFYDEQKYLYFFAEAEQDREIIIWRLDIFNRTNEVFRTKPPLRADIYDYQVADEIVFMIGIYNGKSVALSYNFLDKVPKVLPSFFEEKENIREMQPDFRGNQMNFVITNTSLRACKLFVKPYSNLIGPKKRLEVKYNPRETPLRTFRDAKVFTQEPGKQLILGTYSLNCSDALQGVYSANFSNGEQENLTYFKFTNFTNFFKHHSERRTLRLQEKVAHKAEQGKDYILASKLFLYPQILEKGEELLFVMGGYHNAPLNSNPNNPLAWNNPWLYGNSPNWWMRNNPYWNPFWNPGWMPAATIRNGRIGGSNPNPPNLNFTYAVVCSFDRKGRLLWDNVIKIEDVETKELSEVLKIGYYGDSTVMAYLHKEQIYSKMAHRYRAIQSETAQKVKNIFEGYRLDSPGENDSFMHWYNNQFLLFGEQRLQGPITDEMSRKLFHVSKITFKPVKEEKDKDKKEEKTDNQSRKKEGDNK
ncbi:MAG: hypothetical protein MUE85_06780 [Microscillaceae bacterium]|jgi:hypothetical protein|nr:hypothetical protein [Microscillaceae bacterium]